ncbi:MAG: endonuclease/exonuclease/phosphatase family protein, partial [Acidimicrobiia bacterium]
LIAAALLRARITILLAVAGVALNGLVVMATLNTQARTARVGAPTITIGHLNAQSRSVDVDGLGRYLRTEAFDLFVVLDPKQSDLPRLAEAAPGYRVFLNGSLPGSDHQYVRTVVLTKIAVRNVGHPDDLGFGASAVELTTEGADATSIVVFGSDSPTTPSRAQHRDRVLDAAARWSRNHSARRIVMGDFNATPWSPSFQRLLHRGGLFNSLDGFGLQVSWPESNVLLRIPIDHALLGPDLAAIDRGTGPAFGSQHRSLHLTVARRNP